MEFAVGFFDAVIAARKVISVRKTNLFFHFFEWILYDFYAWFFSFFLPFLFSMLFVDYQQSQCLTWTRSPWLVTSWSMGMFCLIFFKFFNLRDCVSKYGKIYWSYYWFSASSIQWFRNTLRLRPLKTSKISSLLQQPKYLTFSEFRKNVESVLSIAPYNSRSVMIGNIVVNVGTIELFFLNSNRLHKKNVCSGYHYRRQSVTKKLCCAIFKNLDH